MPFTIVVDGLPVVCESPTDAVALAKFLKQSQAEAPTPPRTATVTNSDASTVTAITAVAPRPPRRRINANPWGTMSAEAARVAKVLRDTVGEVDTRTLAAKANVETMRLKYATKTIKGILKMLGMDADIVMPLSHRMEAGERKTVYSINEDLRTIWRESLV